MAGKITFVCTATHDGEDCGHDGPTITLVEGLWAYCGPSGSAKHIWKRLDGDGVTLDEITLKNVAHKQLTT